MSEKSRSRGDERIGRRGQGRTVRQGECGRCSKEKRPGEDGCWRAMGKGR